MIKTSPFRNQGKVKGCLLVTLLVIFCIASGFFFLTTDIREAKRGEQTLLDQYGWADEYTPTIDGSIESQRIESFIRVREAVQDNCAAYQAVLSSIDKLETLDTEEDISAEDAASTSMESFKSIFSAGSKMVEFSEVRNQALLSETMGLGEYIYMYLLIYGEQLANDSGTSEINRAEAQVSQRTREEYTQILINQLDALDADGSDTASTGLVDKLRMEIDALQNLDESSSWPEAAVRPPAESILPYQQRLASLYCSGIVKLELLQKNRGFNLDG